MKHILLREKDRSLDDIIQDIPRDHSIEIAFDVNRLDEQGDVDGIVFVMVDEDGNFPFEKVRARYPANKIILLSNKLSDKVIKDLQYKREAFDLFFRYPAKFTNIYKMYEMISVERVTQLVNVQQKYAEKKSEPEKPTSSGIEMTLQKDNVYEDGDIERNQGTMTSTNSFDLEKEIQNAAKTGGASPSSPDEISRLLTADMWKEEFQKSDETASITATDTQTNTRENDGSFTEMNYRPKELEKPAPAKAKVVEPVDNDATVAIKLPTSAEKAINQGIQYADSSRTHIAPPKMSQVDTQESVQFHDVVQAKEEQNFRLLGINKSLKDKIRDDEVKISNLERELQVLKNQYERANSLKEESIIEIEILKKRLEKDRKISMDKEELLIEKIKVLEKKLEHSREVQDHQENKKLFDVKRIKAREDELEEKLALLQADTAMQLHNREQKIIELKRKIDLLDFDLKDSLSREERSKEKIRKLEASLDQVGKSLGGVLNILDDDHAPPSRELKKV
jgi:hypothetical protein